MGHSNSALPRYLVVGFVGARHIDREDLVRKRIEEVLARLHAGSRGSSLAAVSSLALGADTVFAEVVSRMPGVPHRVFLPQTEDLFFSLKDFESETQLARSQQLLGGSSANIVEVRVVSTQSDRGMRFYECGDEILKECDVLIAVHADDQPGKPGGTLGTLQQARSVGRHIFEIVLDADMTIRETPARDAGPSAQDEDEVFKWSLDVDPNAADKSMELIRALKAKASDVSSQEKRNFALIAGTAVWTHVAATATAAIALALTLDSIWLKVLKGLLLLAGLGVPFYFHKFRQRPERLWVTGRLVAELTRSVIAVRGLPGNLGYLRDFYLPGYRNLIRSLDLLRLQAVDRAPGAEKRFVATYISRRLGEAGAHSRETQIGYFFAKGHEAEKYRHNFERAFYSFSAVSLVCAVVYAIVGGFHLIHVEATSPVWQKVLFWFIPIAFPTAAAACAGWISIMDYDRRSERYRGLVEFLEQQREEVRNAAGHGNLARAVNRTEHALLQEIVEWHAKQSHARGH